MQAIALQNNGGGWLRNADAFLREELEEAADRVVIASDDGSIGIKGTVLDAMEAEGVTGDCIFSCGPTPMLRGVKQWAFEKQIPAWFQWKKRWRAVLVPVLPGGM